MIFAKNNGSLRGLSSWSNMSIHKALKLNISCGTSGYEEILRQGLPFPTIRTIQRHIQDLKFKPGILTEIIDLLKVKVHKKYFWFSSVFKKFVNIFLRSRLYFFFLKTQYF
jgi:hypothetical protein